MTLHPGRAADPIPLPKAVAAALARGGVKSTDPKRAKELQSAAIEERRRETMMVQETRRLAREIGAQEMLEMFADPDNKPDVANLARACVVDLAQRILGGEFPFKDAGQAASVAKTMFDIHRLETNQATVLTEMSAEERDRRIQELRDRVNQTTIPTTARVS